jgi:phage shock protein C
MSQSFRLDRANSRVMGVCAGLASRYGWDVTFTRVAMVLGLFLLGPITLIAYLLLGWLAD